MNRRKNRTASKSNVSAMDDDNNNPHLQKFFSDLGFVDFRDVEIRFTGYVGTENLGVGKSERRSLNALLEDE